MRKQWQKFVDLLGNQRILPVACQKEKVLRIPVLDLKVVFGSAYSGGVLLELVSILNLDL